MHPCKPSRKTKIVCTLGPASDSSQGIRRLVDAGMNVVRLNFSHGDRDSHREAIRRVRRVSRETGEEVGILQDLGGPKIRLGTLPVPQRELLGGEEVVFRAGESSDSDVLPVNYPFLTEDVAMDDRILLGDGLVELVVTDKRDGEIRARVLVGGVIHSHKGVNLPLSDLRVPAFTEKDREDLKAGLEEGVDFVALSFVRNERDIKPVREILNRLEYPPLLIAKIEKPQAVERLERILSRVDGVMVARGDLGVEMPLEEVPVIQKRIIHMARQAGKPVITATQMLRSMVSSPRPTRAEATDVANAIFDRTDALMLSEETAMGEYPAEAVSMLDRIARSTEPYLDPQQPLKEPLPEKVSTTQVAISRSACWLARDLDGAAVVASTSSGSTARQVSRFRPSCPVIGFTPHLSTQRQLTLSWGVIPVLVDHFTDTDEMLGMVRGWTRQNGIARASDRIIITAGVPLGACGTTNLIKVLEIQEE